MSTAIPDNTVPDPVNAKLRATRPSASLEAAQLARDLRARGRKVISLATGEPDFPTPDHIKKALVDALAADHTGYPPVPGILPLREAICAKFRDDNGLDYDPSQVIVANGAKQIIFNAMAASLEPGQEVLVPTPGWVSYAEMVRLNDGVPIELPCRWEERFRLRPEALEAAITDRTRWLILNNPSNPTGAVMAEAELRALAEVLERHPHVLVLSDDIYAPLSYTGQPHATLSVVCPDLADRILTVSGASKSHAMTGFRIGVSTGPEWLIKAMTKLQSQSTSCPSSISQAAAAMQSSTTTI